MPLQLFFLILFFFNGCLLVKNSFSETLIIPPPSNSIFSNISIPIVNNLVAENFVLGGYEVGYGIDTLTGVTRNKCVAIKPSKPSGISAGAYNVTFHSSLIESSYDLAKAMRVHAKATLDGLGAGSFSGKLNWVNERTINDQSVYLLAHVEVKLQEEKAEIEGLDSKFKLLLNSKDGLELFHQTCGNAFAIGTIKGGEYFVLFEFKINSTSEKEALFASLKAKTGTWSVAAEFENTTTSATKLTRVDTHQFYSGPMLTESLPTGDAISFINFAAKFPTLINSQLGYEYSVTISDYGIFPEYMELKIKNSDLARRQQMDTIDELESIYRRIITRLNAISYIKEHTSQYDFSKISVSELEDMEKKLRKFKKEIVSASSNCYTDVQQCDNAATITDNLTQLPLPKRNSRIIQNASCISGSENSGFADSEGGCKDFRTGFVWSQISLQRLNYSDADKHCSQHIQNGVPGWILPSSNDLMTIAGKDLGIKWLVGNPSGWFWTSDKKRITLETATMREFELLDFALGVLCIKKT